MYIILSSPYLPSDILREIYDMNAYLKLICLTLGSPFSLHHVKENDYLIKARYIYTLTKTEPLNVKTFLQLCIKKTFSLRKGLFFVLVLFFLYLYLRIFIVTRTFLISAVQVIKILPRSFPSLFFARPLISKQTTKQFTKFSVCKFFSWKNSKTSTQLALTLRFLLGLR